MAQETDKESPAGREPELAPAAPEPAAAPAEPVLPLPQPTADEPTMVRDVLATLLELMGARTHVEVELRPDGYYANLKTRTSNGLLIGYRGTTMRSLQYLVRVIVRKHYPEVPMITVDVSGYLARRDSFLSKKATAVARIVLETRREMALDMLTEKEMETVEHALEAIPDVRVYALGTGQRRNVIIAPLP
jgi:spoIIIJ-associated protein